MANIKNPYARIVLKLKGDEVSIPVHTHRDCQPAASHTLRRIATEYRNKAGVAPAEGLLIRHRDNTTLATWTSADGFLPA